jgi:hypothetical protein
MSKRKEKAIQVERTPKPKKKLGLSIRPALRMPHEDLIRPYTDADAVPSQTSLFLDQAKDQTDLVDQRSDRFRLPESSSLPKSEAQGYPMNSLVETTSLPAVTSLSNSTSLPEVTSLPENNRLPNLNSLPKVDSQQADGWASIRKAKGHTKLPNSILDELCKILDPVECIVYIQLYRLSWGFGKDNCNIGLPKLAERTNTGKSTVQRAIAKLIQKNLIEKIQWEIGKGKEQGTIYRLPIPNSLFDLSSLPELNSLPGLNTNKEDLLKTNNRKALRDKLKRIVDQIRQTNVGSNVPLSTSELAARVKDRCARDGVHFDNDLFQEIVS